MSFFFATNEPPFKEKMTKAPLPFEEAHDTNQHPEPVRVEHFPDQSSGKIAPISRQVKHNFARIPLKTAPGRLFTRQMAPPTGRFPTFRRPASAAIFPLGTALPKRLVFAQTRTSMP
jgi:hypothetical protein